MHKIYSIFLFVTTTILLISTSFSFANDTTTEFAGGNIIFKENKDIIIEKEDLSISEKLVDVSYVFYNSSDQNITCKVAFPIPSYNYDAWSIGGVEPRPFNFKLCINNEQKDYDTYHKAIGPEGKDVTEKLLKLKIPLESFKPFDIGPYGKQKFHYSNEQLKVLKASKLIDEYNAPTWDLQTIYYWTQTFPAKSRTLVRHTYTPSSGGTFYGVGSVGASVPEDGCLDEAGKKWIEKNLQGGVVNSIEWISYILTTANNWKKPIKDFHLTVKKSGPDELVTFCFEGNVKKTGPFQFESTVKDFVPTKEIKVYYVIRGKE